MRRVATEHSRNDGSKAQYYVVILDRLQDRSGGLERAPESQIRGPLTGEGQEYQNQSHTGDLMSRRVGSYNQKALYT